MTTESTWRVQIDIRVEEYGLVQVDIRSGNHHWRKFLTPGEADTIARELADAARNGRATLDARCGVKRETA